MSELPQSERARPRPWSLGVRLLHWLTVPVVGYALFLAFFVMGPGLATMVWLPVHATIGFVILGFVAIRLPYRLFDPRPSYGSRPTRTAAWIVQAGLYCTLLAVIVTGWIAYRPMPLMPAVKLAGLLELPVFPATWLPPWPYPLLHRVLTWIFVGLLAAHIAAALMHLLLRDGVVSAILWRRKTPQ